MSRTFHIPITPVGKPRMTQRDVWMQRLPVVRYRQYCDDLRAALPGYELPERLCLTFFIAMPTSWSQKRKAERLGSAHDQKPDIDNLCKAFMDAFKSEDKHVYALSAEKYWADAGSIEVTR